MCARLAIFSRTMLATVHRDRPSMPSGLIVLSVVATFVVRQEHIVILDRAPPMRRGILAGPGRSIGGPAPCWGGATLLSFVHGDRHMVEVRGGGGGRRSAGFFSIPQFDIRHQPLLMNSLREARIWDQK